VVLVLLAVFLLGDYSAREGALGSALVAHGSSVTALLLALPLLGRGKARRASTSGMIWAAAAGLTDAVGLLLAVPSMLSHVDTAPVAGRTGALASSGADLLGVKAASRGLMEDPQGGRSLKLPP
jgi:hypothetical protein